MSKESHEMNPISRERVEVDGLYTNEWGRVETLHRGQHFPTDPQLGASEWVLQEFSYDNHHEGLTDKRLVPEADKDIPPPKQVHPRLHRDRGDK